MVNAIALSIMKPISTFPSTISGMRSLNRSLSLHPLRKLSLTSRGKPISHEELYRYTNGRFLIDEKMQYDRRYVKFNLDKLCDIVAALESSNCSISAIEKMEGSFSKALLMRREDEKEYIAKIRCANAGPPFYTTASEVATLQYVRAHTKVPVPRVLAWNSDSSNTVGCEYIIMEKAEGVQLFRVWADMEESSRMTLIERLTKLECELSSIRFPAIGSLYLRESIAAKSKQTPLESSIDTSGSYCIGPSCDRSWLKGPALDLSEPDLDTGPWTSPSPFGIALAKREIRRLLDTQKPDKVVFPKGSAEEPTSLLEKAIILLKSLQSHPALSQYGRASLWHTDLHMGNIFVSEEDVSQITSIIDWQSIMISPLFLQVRWPVFLSPPKGYTLGFTKPKLPEDFDQLDPEDKSIALYEWKRATRAKAYEVCNFLNDRDAHNAMHIPNALRELLVRCGAVSEEGSIPLRACLIEIYHSWQELGLPSKCPITFTEEEIQTHALEFKKYQEWHSVQEFAIEYLDTDAEGWIPPEADFARKLEQNKALFDLYASKMAGSKSLAELRKIWPFSEGL